MSSNKVVPNDAVPTEEMALNLKAIRVATENISRKAKLATGLSNRKAKLEDIANGTNPGMFYGDFDFWYDIIHNDDLKGAQEVLGGAGEEEKTVLMNAPFLFNEVDCVEYGISPKERSSIVLFCKPTSIAVANRSRKVLKLLTENGVHYMSRDTGGNNVFHVMATVAHAFPEHEDEYAEMYSELVEQIDDLSVTRYLLYQENIDGFRPIELTAHYDVYALLSVMFETEGVYKHSSYGMTPMPLVRYDMTEYEEWGVKGRRAKSPLRSLVYLTQVNMKKDSCDKLFQNPLVQMWIRRKFRGVLWMVIVWFLFRTLFLVSFLDSGIEKNILAKKEAVINSTCPNKMVAIKKTLSQRSGLSDSGFSLYYFMVYGFLSMAVDIIEVVALFTFRKTPKRGNALRFWRRCSFTTYTRIAVGFGCSVGIMDILMMKYSMGYLPAAVLPTMTTAGTAIYIFGVMALIWSHLFFLQLIPKIGHFLIGFQWMLLAFFSFVVVFLYIFSSLSIAFNKLYFLSCIDVGFADFGTSIYSTFLVMLNMKSFTYFEADVAILHAVFVFIVALLLLNFLVAILTDTQATVTKHITTIESIQVLDMTLTLEDRFGWLYNQVWNRENHFVFTLKENLIRK